MLIDRQCLSFGVTGNQLELGIGHAGMPGEPGNRLMAECVRCALHAGCLGVVLDNLLDPPGSERTGQAGLKEIAVPGMGGKVGAEGRGKGLSE